MRFQERSFQLYTVLDYRRASNLQFKDHTVALLPQIQFPGLIPNSAAKHFQKPSLFPQPAHSHLLWVPKVFLSRFPLCIWCFVSDTNLSRHPLLTQRRLFTEQQVARRWTHIPPTASEIQYPQSCSQLFSRKLAMTSLSSLTPSPMDHKDLLFVLISSQLPTC